MILEDRTIDNSLRSTFHQCQRRFYWTTRGIVPSREPTYFAFGRAWTQFVGRFHKLQDGGLSLQPSERVEMALFEAEKEFTPSGADGFDKNNSPENLRTLALSYGDHYGPTESWTLVGDELGFSVPIQGTDWFYGGALDGFLYWKPYGLFILENKTTGGYLTDNYLSQWSFSTQITGYIYGFIKTLGEAPWGVLMNMASKLPRKNPSDRFRRTLEQRSSDELKLFEKELCSSVQMIEEAIHHSTWPKTGACSPDNCAGGIGRSSCPYRRLCLIPKPPEEITPDEISATGDLKQREEDWKPWKRRGNQ